MSTGFMNSADDESVEENRPATKYTRIARSQ